MVNMCLHQRARVVNTELFSRVSAVNSIKMNISNLEIVEYAFVFSMLPSLLSLSSIALKYRYALICKLPHHVHIIFVIITGALDCGLLTKCCSKRGDERDDNMVQAPLALGCTCLGLVTSSLALVLTPAHLLTVDHLLTI